MLQSNLTRKGENMDSGHGLILMSLLTASFGSLWGVAKYLLLSRFQKLWEQRASVEQVASDNLVIVLFMARSLFKNVTKILAKSAALAVTLILLYPTITVMWKNFPFAVMLNYFVFNWKLIIQLISV
jgi:hypothetical protein